MSDAVTGLGWRAMRTGDLDAVVEIAAIGFPDHFEGRDCFANRLALYPAGCLVLAGADETAMGYAVAYPWLADAAPALNTLIETIPDDAGVLYLHDLALHPEVRGGGHSRAIVTWLADQARGEGWPSMALIAVNDAVAFWEGHGFSVRDGAGMAEKLRSYGPDARYMVRPLD